MTKSYTQIVKQIEALQQEAEKMRRDEMQGVIDRIREAVRAYNLTAADLGLGGAPRGRPPGKAKAAANGDAADAGAATPGRRRRGPGKAKVKGPKVVKFRNDSGGTWGGIGKRPQWLRDAIAAGRSLQDFAVK